MVAAHRHTAINPRLLVEVLSHLYQNRDGIGFPRADHSADFVMRLG